MIHNHRQVYRVIRDALREGTDKKLLANAEKLRKEGFGWRYDGLGTWATDTIFEQLRALGIDTDQERFEEQARAAGRCLTLEERWRQGVDIDDKTPWDDFPFLAAEELWIRLTPHLLCPEIVANRIEKAIERPLDDSTVAVATEDIEAAVMLMDFLKGFPADQRDAAFEEVMNCSSLDFGEWLIDIAADYGTNHIEEARSIAKVMSQTRYSQTLWTDLADSLVRAERLDEAVQLVNQNLERWPQDVWVRIKSGDVYRDAGDTQTALTCYAAALGMACDGYDWDGAAERLESLLRPLGRLEEWERLARQHPRPNESTFADTPSRSRRASTDPPGNIGVLTSEPTPRLVTAPRTSFASRETPSLSSGKTGRNDPCPCGSGKKYKKCCMGREQA